MAKFQITGTHPVLKVNRIYAVYAPESEIDVYLERARADGWTDLQKHNQPQPSLWPDEPEENKPSVSSDAPTSPKKSESRSVSSEGLLRAGATPTFPSPRKAQKRV